MNTPEPINLLVPEGFQRKLSRRGFLQLGGAASGMSLALVACGSDKKNPSASAPVVSAGPAADGSYSEVINKASGTLAMYTWGEYNDPEVTGALAESSLGITMKLDSYTSNEELIAKLEASKGTSGYDIVVPTGVYIPQMVQKGLLSKLDMSKLPNFANIDKAFQANAWDKGNEYSVCKDWGTTGYLWDSSKVKTPIVTWADFIKVCQNEAKGAASVLDVGADYCGIYFWANGIDWNTTDSKAYDDCEKFMVEFAKNLMVFESYPSNIAPEGALIAGQVWNGDARTTYGKVESAGGDPSVWKWAIGAPETELWMDTYTIPVGAPNPEAAHAWINWIMTPEVALKDMAFHGYNPGLRDVGGLIKKLMPDLERGEMIFFADDAIATMKTQVVNEMQNRQVDILNKAKAAAGA